MVLLALVTANLICYAENVPDWWRFNIRDPECISALSHPEFLQVISENAFVDNKILTCRLNPLWWRHSFSGSLLIYFIIAHQINRSWITWNWLFVNNYCVIISITNDSVCRIGQTIYSNIDLHIVSRFRVCNVTLWVCISLFITSMSIYTIQSMGLHCPVCIVTLLV